MDDSSRTWGWVIAAIVVVLAVVAWLYYTPSRSTEPATTNSENTTTSANGYAPATETQGAVPMTATVTYDGSTFSPAQVTVAEGGTVTFRGQDGVQMWIASGPHPSHEGYSGTTRTAHCPDTAGTAFDQCAAGAVYSFTFQKVGTWKYHDHRNTGATGTVVVVSQ